MRIAIVSDSYWPRVNGVTVSIQSFYDELVARGHEVGIFCPKYPASRGVTRKEKDLHRFRSLPSLVSPEDRLVTIFQFPAVFRAFDRLKPDILYVNTEYNMQFAARFYAKMRGIPLVAVAHTDYENYVGNYIDFVDERLLRATVRLLMRINFGTTDFVVTPSPAMERRLRNYRIRRPMYNIGSGVAAKFRRLDENETRKCREAIARRFPSLAHRRILLFTGRVTAEKDIGFLLPVLRRVLDAGIDAALLVAGDGSARPRLEAESRNAGLADRVVFAGYVSHDELPAIYAAADVFAFPSKTETLGICTIEALATGTPVVAVGEMGTREVMQGDNGGYMVANDVGEFSEAVIRLLKDDSLRRSKADEAVLWAKRFGIASETDKLLALFADIIERRRAKAEKNGSHP